MIDPTEFPKYDLSRNQLEEVILFCIAVAGKNAKTTAANLEQFLKRIGWDGTESPFNKIKSLKSSAIVAGHLRLSGIGCYTLKSLAFFTIANSYVDLFTCTPQQ